MTTKIKILLTLWLALGLQSWALAGGIRLVPLRLDVGARFTTAQLLVYNLSENDIGVQIDAKAWTQENGKDILTPTKDLLFAPPILAVPARKTRVIRFKYRRRSDETLQKAYRVFIQQLAGPPNEEDEDSGQVSSGVDIKLRIGLPFFVAPVKKATPAPALLGYDPATQQVLIKNNGTMHLKVEQVELLAGEGETVLAQGQTASETGGYLLHGTEGAWQLRQPVTGKPLANLPAGNYRIRLYTDFRGAKRNTNGANGAYLLDFSVPANP